MKNKMMDMVCKEFDQIADKGNLTSSNFDMAYKLIMMKEKLLRIEELEGKLGYSEAAYPMPYGRSNAGYARDAYSRGGDWEARGSYDDGNSYRGGRYSRDDGYAMMGNRMEELMNDPQLTPQERNAIKMAMNNMR